MILLTSSAHHIYWLGRYLARVQYLCSQFPFHENQSALDYAHAFCLPAFDASSLNELILDPQQPASFQQQFHYARNNIHDLRGVLSARSFAELNQLIAQAEANATYICDVAGDCHEVLSAEENTGIFLFFSLGQAIEQLDRQIRLGQNRQQTVQQLGQLLPMLHQQGWPCLQEIWTVLSDQPDTQNFYHFSDQIQALFEVDPI